MLTQPLACGSFTVKRVQFCAGLRNATVRKLRDISGIRNREAWYDPLLRERELVARGAKVDLDHIAHTDLAGRDEVGQRVHQLPFDRALQMPRAVLQVCALAQEEVLAYRQCTEDELFSACDAMMRSLYLVQFDVKDLAQVLRISSVLENDNLVDSVHELRRELSLGSFERRSWTSSRSTSRSASRLVGAPDVNPIPPLTISLISTRAQIGGHEDHASRKINLAIVSKRERRFIKNA